MNCHSLAKLTIFCLLGSMLWLALSLGTALAAAEGNSLGSASDAAYVPWQQGRPLESLPLLWERARSTPRWSQWHDAGLCAAAAQQSAAASLALLQAHRLAPWRSEPLSALNALTDAQAPPLAGRWLGPLAMLGDGWWGLLLAVVIGLAVAWWALLRRWSRLAMALSILGALALIPALVLRTVDASQQWLVVAAPTHLLDVSGLPVAALASGQVVVAEAGPSPSGQQRVRLVIAAEASDGAGRVEVGFVPQSDLWTVNSPPPVAQLLKQPRAP